MSVIEITYDMAGANCPYCNSPTAVNDEQRWSCGTPKATMWNPPNTMRVWVLRSNECERRALENMSKSMESFWAHFHLMRERRIMDLILGKSLPTDPIPANLMDTDRSSYASAFAMEQQFVHDFCAVAQNGTSLNSSIADGSVDDT